MTRRQIGVGTASVVVLAVLPLAIATAKPQYIKVAKDAGMPAQNCQYCHRDKLPKKEGFKPEELNERGAWLYAEMQKRKVKDIDAAMLKEYPGGPEQK